MVVTRWSETGASGVESGTYRGKWPHASHREAREQPPAVTTGWVAPWFRQARGADHGRDLSLHNPIRMTTVKSASQMI